MVHFRARKLKSSLGHGEVWIEILPKILNFRVLELKISSTMSKFEVLHSGAFEGLSSLEFRIFFNHHGEVL